MPRIMYVDRRFSKQSMSIINIANAMLEEFANDGLIVTLRQLYYRFVSRDLIPNTEKSYKNLGGVINDARLAGRIDWNAIEDRARSLMQSAHWDSPSAIIDACARQYKVDKWIDQSTRVEVWVEKQALESVVGLAASPMDCAYFACKGYCSQSEMWRAAERFKAYARNGQRTVVIYLGDHDPSGLDMTRDVEERLNNVFGVDVSVERIALNMDQVEKFHPPPNPAKLSDSRATQYVKEFGDESWELDALEPRVLRDLIVKAIGKHINMKKFKAKEKEEKDKRAVLSAISSRWDEVEEQFGGEP